MTALYDSAEAPKKIILVSVETPETEDAQESLEELKELCENLNSQVVLSVLQRRTSPHPATFVGEGKLEELKTAVENLEADFVIFDTELAPTQIRNLEKALKTEIKDRTMVILDIFAHRAATAEGKIQVELARLQYMLPRLKGSYTALSRIGGFNQRGAGETKLELDKRRIRSRITVLKQQIRELQARGDLQRERRKKDAVTTVAICGYTNAGKSTLLNRLTDAGVLAEDKLFATLSPTARKLTLPDKREVLLIDTVGFIRRLPHHLIDAFRSTLDEVRCADLVLLVADTSSPEFRLHLEISEQILDDLKAEGARLQVFNKCDLLESPPPGGVCISAKEGKNLDALLDAIAQKLPRRLVEAELLLPYAEVGATYALKKNFVLEEEFCPDGILLRGKLDFPTLKKFSGYVRLPSDWQASDPAEEIPS